MIRIDIAHPNALDDRRVVDEISDASEIVHALASPVFEWNPYDVVRVTQNGSIIYTGFYASSECIDIGPTSKFCKYLVLGNSKRLSMVEFWQTVNDPNVLLRSLVNYISREALIENAISCIRLASFDVFSNKLLDLIDDNKFNKIAIEKSNMYLSLDRMIGESANRRNDLYYCLNAIRSLLFVVVRPEPINNAIFLLDDVVVSISLSRKVSELEAKAIVTQNARSVIPFSDVLRGVAET